MVSTKDMRSATIALLVLATVIPGVSKRANDWSTGVTSVYDGAGNIRQIGSDYHVYGANSESDASVVVPLCAVVEKPAEYDGKRVTMTGCVTTDGSEYVVLSDLETPCPRGGIVPIDAPTLPLAQQFDGEPDKKVCGTFTGTFRASTALYERVLEVEETSGLTTSALVD